MKLVDLLDLQKNSLKAARIENLATAPSSPVAGQVYYDTVLLALRMYDGSAWISVSVASLAALQPLTTRGDLLTRDGTTHIRLPLGASSRYLRSNGTDPAWSQIDASSDLIGAVPAANGGTSADLSATGGANQVVRQNSAGGAWG